MLGGMRGAEPLPPRPLRGNEKVVVNEVDKLLRIADGVVIRWAGEDAAMQPYQRYMMADGAASLMQQGTGQQLSALLVKWIGPLTLAAGVGLWAWQIYDIKSANRTRRASVPRNSLGDFVQRAAGSVRPGARATAVRQQPAAGPSPIATDNGQDEVPEQPTVGGVAEYFITSEV